MKELLISSLIDYTDSQIQEMIGCKVIKVSNKPFKSGSRVNTVKGVMEHPLLRIPCFTFNEDDSYVEARRCKKYE